MKLTLAEPTYLKDSISIISELVTEGRFRITPDAVELVAMDPANVAMVIYKLLSSCFVEYEVEKDADLCINLDSLKQVLRRSKGSDAITLETDEGNTLNITLKGKTKRTFSIPLIEMDEKEQKVPDLTFPVIIDMKGDQLSEAIEDISVVSESVNFICEPKKLTVKGEGDFSKASVEISEGAEITNDDKDPVQSKYSVEYLKKMIPGSKLTNEVKIMFDKDYPLKLDFREVDKVQLSFILAPRVENT